MSVKKTHTRKLTVLMPKAEIQIVIKGEYADVELEYMRVGAIVGKECALRREVGRRGRLFRKAPSAKEMGL